MTGSADFDLDRRQFVKGAAAMGALGTTTLAGCTDDGGPALLHGWTGGDGAEAASALEDAFREEYPDNEIQFDAIGGGGNEDLDQVIASRFESDDPPALFAGWPGPNLVQYEGVLGDVEDVWDEEGFKDAHVDEVVEACDGPDGFSAVPIGSHRMNDLFYNVEVLDEAGVDPQTDIDTVDDFVDALDAIEQNTDATPYVNTLQTWTILQFWAVNMLGTQGYQAYIDFIEGNGDQQQVQAAFEEAERVLSEYINDDAAEVEFTEANQRLMNGDAGFTHQGNWVAGAYVTEDLEFGTDWDRIQYPGTEDMYGLHFDSFIYPDNNPAPEAAQEFLRFAGSETAHVEFNRLKGSIPTREVDTSDFSSYLTETIDDFQNASERPPTIAHGLAVTQPVQSDLEDVIADNFSDPFDAEAAAQGFVDAV